MQRARRVENEVELSIARAAHFLEVSVASVRNFRKKNLLPGSHQIHTVTGDAWVVPMADLRKLKAERAARLSSRADHASSARTPATDEGKDTRTPSDKNEHPENERPMSAADLERVVRGGGGVQANEAAPVKDTRPSDVIPEATLAVHGINPDKLAAALEVAKAFDHLKRLVARWKG